MKILHYASFLGDSGVAKVTVELCNEMVAQGNDVTLVSQTANDDIKFFPNKNVNLINVGGASRGFSLKAKGAFYRSVLKGILGRIIPWFLNRHRFKSRFSYSVGDLTCYDLIFVHCLPGKLLLSSIAHDRVFYVIHNTKSLHLKTEYMTSSFFNKFFFYQALKDKRLIAVSDSVKSDLVKNFGFNDSNCGVIYNPFNFEKIINLRNKLSKLKDAKRLVSIGRLSDQKRFDRLLNAVYLMQKKGVFVDVYILGEGPCENKLKALSKQLGIDSYINFEGFVKNPYSYLNRDSIFVLSSDFEGLPTVLIEAALCDCRIIATPVSGAYEILGDDYPFVSNGFSSQELADLIILSIEGNESVYYPELEKFSSQIVVRRYLSLFNSGLEGLSTQD